MEIRRSRLRDYFLVLLFITSFLYEIMCCKSNISTTTIKEELQVASRPCIVDDMICYVCFRSQYHERNRFPEDVGNPAAVYCNSKLYKTLVTKEEVGQRQGIANPRNLKQLHNLNHRQDAKLNWETMILQICMN